MSEIRGEMALDSTSSYTMSKQPPNIFPALTSQRHREILSIDRDILESMYDSWLANAIYEHWKENKTDL
jgi:hypothetical protein